MAKKIPTCREPKISPEDRDRINAELTPEFKTLPRFMGSAPASDAAVIPLPPFHVDLRVHVLKSRPEHYGPTLRGDKKFEIRVSDRDFQAGDYLVLQEYEPRRDQYTGAVAVRKVKQVFADLPGIADGYVLMSIQEVSLELADKIAITIGHSFAPAQG